MPTDILLVSIACALVEVAGMLLLGQGLLWIFRRKARDGNFVYDLFKKGTAPIVKLARDYPALRSRRAHIGFVAFLILVWALLALGYAKRYSRVTENINRT